MIKTEKVNIVLFFAIISQVIRVWQMYTMKYRKQRDFLVKTSRIIKYLIKWR